jgi:hypothetical protein
MRYVLLNKKKHDRIFSTISFSEYLLTASVNVLASSAVDHGFGS